MSTRVLNQKKSMTVVGTGFIPLDIVLDQEQPETQRTYVGGTCGNVLTALSFFGWSSFPVARIRNDPAGVAIRRDLEKWGVRTDLLSLTPVADTPIVVERIGKTSKGAPFHRFSWTCPKCGAWLPGYRPVIAKSVERITEHVPNADVFFFDRVSRATVEMARYYSGQGAWIVFEPSATSDAKLFRESLEYTHILKYSNERMNEHSRLKGTEEPRLQVETLGAEGLRYRTPRGSRELSQWQEMPALRIDTIKDTAGAGDWCTAGMIHALVQLGRPNKVQLSRARIEEALTIGQAFAAWTCQFAGARGGMYQQSRKTTDAQISGMVSGYKLDDMEGKGGRRKRSSGISCLSASCSKQPTDAKSKLRKLATCRR